MSATQKVSVSSEFETFLVISTRSAIRNIFGDFNAPRNKEDNWKMKQFCDQDYDLPDFENDSSL